MSDSSQESTGAAGSWASRRKSTVRKAVGTGHESLIQSSLWEGGKTLPLVIQPALSGVDLAAWAGRGRDFIETSLMKHGAILFRGFKLGALADFESFIGAVSGELLEYKERSSPRSQVQGRVYTSTDHPPDQRIFLHNENSYQRSWPLRIFFYCATAPDEGGETPIADCRGVYKRINPSIRDRFQEKKWMYVRNFHKGFGLDWQTVFQTTDRSEVEEHCGKRGIAAEWLPDGRLRTRAIRNAISRHPRTGEFVWFNHATFFNVTTLEASVRQALLREFQEEDLPTNTYYGDGSRIEPEVLEHLREAYRQETVSFPWKQGDLMMLDNMLAAHGRGAYAGPRKIVVAMSELYEGDATAE